MNGAGADLLERALSYALCTVQAVARDDLVRPTPCRGWDLRMLLDHVNDSLCVLLAGLENGLVAPMAAPAGADTDPIEAFRVNATRLVGACAGPEPRVILVGGCPMAAAAMAEAGALEVAVHGWDVAQACGLPRPIPYGLARELLDVGMRLVTDRRSLFAPAVPIASSADPSDRLVAFLGRDPAGVRY